MTRRSHRCFLQTYFWHHYHFSVTSQLSRVHLMTCKRGKIMIKKKKIRTFYRDLFVGHVISKIISYYQNQFTLSKLTFINLFTNTKRCATTPNVS